MIIAFSWGGETLSGFRFVAAHLSSSRAGRDRRYGTAPSRSSGDVLIAGPSEGWFDGMPDRPAVINSVDAQSAPRRMTGGIRRSTFDP
jgi:hypothetical protein